MSVFNASLKFEYYPVKEDYMLECNPRVLSRIALTHYYSQLINNGRG